MKHPLYSALGLFWTLWFLWGYCRGAEDRDLIYRGFFATLCLIGTVQP